MSNQQLTTKKESKLTKDFSVADVEGNKGMKLAEFNEESFYKRLTESTKAFMRQNKIS